MASTEDPLTRPPVPSTRPTPSVDREGALRALELERAHVFQSWAAQEDRNPLVVAGGSGAWVWDGDGTPYLDFASQLVFTNLGLGHPRVVEAIRSQAVQLVTVAPQHATGSRSEAARMIVERAEAIGGDDGAPRAPSGHFRRVFLTNGGADAVENAVRMARLHTGRRKVLARYRSYHGNTTTAINLTGDPRRWPNDYGSEGVVHFFGPYLYRSAFEATTQAEECERALRHLEQVIQLEGPQTIAAIILESIPGTAGIMVPPPGYLAGVRELCDRHGIVWIADEVMSGFGRAGRWFACELAGAGVRPDLITFAKGVNSGYVPLGGVIVSAQICDTFATRPFPGGLTYSGHPLACAAAVATMSAMAEEGVVERADRLGREVVGPALVELAERHPIVGQARGAGAFWALELVRDKASREPLVPFNATGGANAPMAQLSAACRERGLLPFVNGSRTHVVPPLVITDDEVRYGIALLTEALDEVAAAL